MGCFPEGTVRSNGLLARVRRSTNLSPAEVAALQEGARNTTAAERDGAAMRAANAAAQLTWPSYQRQKGETPPVLPVQDDPFPEAPASRASTLLRDAALLVDGDRRADYGDPEAMHSRIAALWNAYLGPDHAVTPHDAAIMLALLKVARISGKPEHEDSHVDAVAYIALAYEIVTKDS